MNSEEYEGKIVNIDVSEYNKSEKLPVYQLTEEEREKYHPSAFESGFNRKTRRKFGVVNLNFNRRGMDGKPAQPMKLAFKKSLMEVYNIQP